MITIHLVGALLVVMMCLVPPRMHTNPVGILRGSAFQRTRLKERNTRGGKELCPVTYNPTFTGKEREEETLKNNPVGASQPLKEVWRGGLPPLGSVGHRPLVA